MNIQQAKILSLVLAERNRQDEKWGEQNHVDDRWLSIFTEEFGEVAKAMNEEDDYETGVELIQCIAVLFGWLECRIRHQTRMSEADTKPPEFK